VLHNASLTAGERFSNSDYTEHNPMVVYIHARRCDMKVFVLFILTLTIA
jgi:hypothetical protein